MLSGDDLEVELELEVGDELLLCFDLCELFEWLELGEELFEWLDLCELFE